MATPVNPTPHRWRFALINAFLVIAAGAAIAAAVIVARQPSPAPTAAWPWKPPPATVDPLEAIAQHVELEYRSPQGGGPLFAIDRGGLQDGDKPVALARLTDAQNHRVGIYGGRTALFKLTPRCGKKGCSTAPAQLVATAALTRRQGLELALYTLRNVKDVSNVLIVLPPPPQKTQPPQAMVFQRGEIAARLAEPLHLPGSSSRVTDTDVTAIARSTAPYVFKLGKGRVAAQDGHPQEALIVTPQQ